MGVGKEMGVGGERCRLISVDQLQISTRNRRKLHIQYQSSTSSFHSASVISLHISCSCISSLFLSILSFFIYCFIFFERTEIQCTLKKLFSNAEIHMGEYYSLIFLKIVTWSHLFFRKFTNNQYGETGEKQYILERDI